MTLPLPALAADPAVVPLYAAIHDVRFTASRAFAAEAQRYGTPGKAIDGKVHDLWYDDLHHHWNAKPLALAGMTTPDALFLLEMMGQEAGMRVVYRAHHVLGAGGNSAEHRAFGPIDLLTQHPELDGSDAKWGRTAAHIVTAWPSFAVATAPRHSSIEEANRHAIGRDALVTWLMVPASRLS